MRTGCPFFFSHFVVALLLPADVHLRVREPGVGVHVERASVSGTDAEAMSGGLAFSGFEAPARLQIYAGSLAL